MANQTNSIPQESATERVPASATMPRVISAHQMEVERIGGQSSGNTNEFPKVRGGVCSWCGVIDSNVPSEYQYKLCQHYRGKQLMCSYCPASKNVDDVIAHSVMRVIQHPENPYKLIVYCDSYDCLKRHEDKWKVAA